MADDGACSAAGVATDPDGCACAATSASKLTVATAPKTAARCKTRWECQERNGALFSCMTPPSSRTAFCRPILGKGFLSSFVALAVELVQIAPRGTCGRHGLSESTGPRSATGLLRPRRERRRDWRRSHAAEKRHELAAPHVPPQSYHIVVGNAALCITVRRQHRKGQTCVLCVTEILNRAARLDSGRSRDVNNVSH